MTEIVLISIIGGLLNLDERALFQSMVSRPLVTSPLVGLILGHLLADPWKGLSDGLFIGALLELIWIKAIPIGTYVPPNGCLAAVLGVGLSQMLNGERITVLMVSLSLAILYGSVLRWPEIKNRYLNNILANLILRSVKEGRLTRLEGINAFAILITFSGGILLLFIGLFLGMNLGQLIIDSLSVDMERGLFVSLNLVGLIGLAAALEFFFSSKRLWPYLCIGIVLVVGLTLVNGR